MSIIVRKTYYWVSDKCNNIEKDFIELFVPQTHKSKEYKNWIAILDLKTCLVRRNCHVKIYKFYEQHLEQPPVHNNYCIMWHRGIFAINIKIPQGKYAIYGVFIFDAFVV